MIVRDHHTLFGGRDKLFPLQAPGKYSTLLHFSSSDAAPFNAELLSFFKAPASI